MLKRITKKRPYCLIPLLVILYIAIGLPLVHPLLHHPSDDHRRLTHNCDHHLFVAIELPLVHPLYHQPSGDDHNLTHHCAHHHGGAHDDDDQATECQVCQFLLTSQWLTSELNHGIPTKIHLELLNHVYFLPETDTDLKLIKPRAPPEVT